MTQRAPSSDDGDSNSVDRIRAEVSPNDSFSGKGSDSVNKRQTRKGSYRAEASRLEESGGDGHRQGIEKYLVHRDHG